MHVICIFAEIILEEPVQVLFRRGFGDFIHYLQIRRNAIAIQQVLAVTVKGADIEFGPIRQNDGCHNIAFSGCSRCGIP